MDCIATFYTHIGAIEFASALAEKSVKHKLMPVPRRLSSSCGTCVRFEADDPLSFICEDVEQIFLLEEKGESLIFSRHDGEKR